MALGASLWGAYNQTAELGLHITKPGWIGCQYGYQALEWQPGSPVFSRARATGIHVSDYQNVILVNQTGRRFYDETQGGFTSNNYNLVRHYTRDSYRNAANAQYAPANFLDAALAGTGESRNGGGPIWAILDSEAVKRETWTLIWSDLSTRCGSVGLFCCCSSLFARTGGAAAGQVLATIDQSDIRGSEPHNHDPSGAASD
jgi:hypothetical protein